MTDVSVPDLGDFADVPVIETHVAPGDVVSNEDPLVTLESDKATMDIPAPAAGTVRELRVKVGDRVSRGSPILLLHRGGGRGRPRFPVPAPRHRRGGGRAAAADRPAGAARAGRAGPAGGGAGARGAFSRGGAGCGRCGWGR